MFAEPLLSGRLLSLHRSQRRTPFGGTCALLRKQRKEQKEEESRNTKRRGNSGSPFSQKKKTVDAGSTLMTNRSHQPLTVKQPKRKREKTPEFGQPVSHHKSRHHSATKSCHFFYFFRVSCHSSVNINDYQTAHSYPFRFMRLSAKSDGQS